MYGWSMTFGWLETISYMSIIPSCKGRKQKQFQISLQNHTFMNITTLHRTMLGRPTTIQSLPVFTTSWWVPSMIISDCLKYIIFSLEYDVIEYVHQLKYGVKLVMTDVLQWLAKNIEKTLELRKEDLQWKRAGSLLTSTELRLVWLKMVQRPFIKNPHPDKLFILKQQKKFNELLEKIMLKFLHSHILEICFPDESTLFEASGNLSSSGVNLYWSELHKTMKKFDRGEINLHPGKLDSGSGSSGYRHTSTHRKKSSRE